MALPIQECPLCLVVGEVHDSHIIPKFIGRQILRAHGAHPVHFSRDRRHQSNHQYKEYLLCEECEKRVRDGGENYVAPLLVNGSDGRAPIQDRTLPSPYEGFRYTDTLDVGQLVYFGLSILWRVAVSKRQGFESVQLGPHEEPLRRYLHSGDNSELSTNLVIHLGYLEGPGVVEVTLPPTPTRVAGRRMQYLVAGGLEYRIYLGGLPGAESRDVRRGLIGVIDYKTSEAFNALVEKVRRRKR